MLDFLKPHPDVIQCMDPACSRGNCHRCRPSYRRPFDYPNPTVEEVARHLRVWVNEGYVRDGERACQPWLMDGQGDRERVVRHLLSIRFQYDRERRP